MITEEEQKKLSNEELEKLSDEDNINIIKEYKRGIMYSKEFIRSLNFPLSQRECLDYNDSLARVVYYQNQVESFDRYIETLKTLFKEE